MRPRAAPTPGGHWSDPGVAIDRSIVALQRLHHLLSRELEELGARGVVLDLDQLITDARRLRSRLDVAEERARRVLNGGGQ